MNIKKKKIVLSISFTCFGCLHHFSCMPTTDFSCTPTVGATTLLQNSRIKHVTLFFANTKTQIIEHKKKKAPFPIKKTQIHTTPNLRPESFPIYQS
jgi:hypothetical protein